MKKIFSFAAVLLLTTGLAIGQSQNGSISGIVTDSTGAVVPNATVTVTNVGTGAVRTTKTTSAGDYRFEGLPPQDYTVTVAASGFAEVKTAKFNVSVGSSNVINAKVSPKGDTSVVEVAANSLAGINLEDAEISQVIDNVQLTELPTSTRNPYAFVSLAPTATSDPTGTNRGTGVALGGARSASTEILLDGVENTYLFSVGVATQTPLDSVQEYRVITSNYGPEYGRASGGVVNVITKAGTNALHGAAWEFYRPSTFVSTQSFNKAQLPPIAQHRFVRNEFGFVLGGPIKRDKLFFFGGNEWLRVRSSNAALFVVPTSQFIGLSSAATQGFFTAYGNLTATPLGNPYTLCQIGTLGSQVAGQGASCPGGPAVSAAFSTDRTKLLTVPGFSDSTPILQLTQVTVPADSGGGAPQNTYNPIGRLDFNMTDKTQMYARYILFNSVQPTGAGNVSPYAGYNTAVTQKSQNLVYGITHVFGQHLTSQVQLGLLRINQNQPLGDRPAGPTLFVNSTTASVGGNNLVFPGYSETSASNGLPSGGPQNNITVSPLFTYVKGAHTMTFGGQYTYIRDNHTFPIYDNAQESLVSSGTQGALSNFQGGLFNYFQVNIDPQGKYPCTKNLTTGLTPGISAGTTFDPTCTITTPIGLPVFGRSNRYQESAYFFNEQWKATHRLTLNVGLRYELYGTQHNKDANLDSNFYFGTTGTIFDQVRNGKILRVNDTAPAGVQNPGGKLWNTNYKQFAPRLAFAYDLTGDGKTSLRGGYGISYERNFGNVTYNVALNPPGQFAISITNNDNGGASFPISTGTVGPFSSIAGIQKALPQASVRAVDPKIKPAYQQFYTLGLERQVFKSLAVAATYQGARGIHGYSIANYNRSYYGRVYENDAATYTNGTNNTNRLNPQYTSINVRSADADSYYSSLNISVRASNLGHTGLTITSNYTFAHSTDDLTSTFASDGGSNGVDVGGVAYFDPFNKALDHGNSDNDVKHRLAMGLVYNTPSFGTSGLIRRAVEGWEFGTQFIAVTGTPFTLFDGAPPEVTVEQRARFLVPVNHERVRGSTPVAAAPGYYNYIDLPVRGTDSPTNPNYGYYRDPKVGFADLPTVTGAGDTFFNSTSTGIMSARNSFRGPGSYTWNADLNKNVKIKDRYTLQLRLEVYNPFNHANEFLNFGGANDVAQQPYVQTYKNGQRQLQLAGKFLF